MESEFIDWLRTRVVADRRVPIGPGDDAAVVQLSAAGRAVLTTDLLTDGVDFLLPADEPRRIGRKALAVNLSDLAAMAACPVAVLVSIALPRQGADSLARELYDGIFALAREFDVALAGGDTNTWDGRLVISITALGELTTHGPLRRNGAVPGDHILVTGRFGGSILGKQFDFQPRVREALVLHQRYQLHAGIDVSDGLSLDLTRLVRESSCGAVIDLDHVPIDPAAHQLAETGPPGISPLQHALGDGEDFELILTASSEQAEQIVADQPLGVPITNIGQVIQEPGLWQRSTNGRLQPLAPRGFEH